MSSFQPSGFESHFAVVAMGLLSDMVQPLDIPTAPGLQLA
jgi:hypothetical protein